MGSYVWPCPKYSRVTSKFSANRYHPNDKVNKPHNGVDLGAPSGSPILATKPGTVTTATYNGSYGNWIALDHGGGITSRYAHASKLLVKAGQKVKAGQTIALVGTTGNSTGNHLHFEIRISGTPKNPLNYVSAKDTTANYTGGGGTATSADTPTGGSGGGSSGGGTAPQSKEITTVVVKSATGLGTSQKNLLSGVEPYLQHGVEILIQHDQIYLPCVSGDVVLERERKSAPSKLRFTVVKDAVLNFQEGNPVSFRFNGKPVFYGYVFKKERKDLRTIDVTCYDQMRYLKNKDTLSYANKTYSELLKMLAADYQLRVGSVDDTGYKIASRIEEGTLFDILGNASDLTVLNTGKLFVLYDDFGALCLQNIQNMKLDIVVDEDTGQSYDYTSSIDDQTYNRIKLAVDNGESGEREVHTLGDPANQSLWGILQYYNKENDEITPATLKAKSEILLNYYNKKQRKLRVNGVFGDIRVRGGSSVVVMMGLGDINVKNYMVVESVKHTFTRGLHSMDLTLSGIRGEFTA